MKSDKERLFTRCVITVLDLKYLKGEYLDYVWISSSLLLEYWMKRMIPVSFSLLEKRRIYKRRITNFTLSMQLLSDKNWHIQARYYYYPTEVMKSAEIKCNGRNHENFIL